MRSLIQRAWRAVSPAARADRLNIAALAQRLCLPEAEAAALYRRSREVGFPAALTEREAVPVDGPRREADDRPVVPPRN